MAQTLTGRVALITGGGRVEGIGQGALKAMLDRDIKGVMLTDINVQAIQPFLDTLPDGLGGRVAVLEHDVTDEAQWKSVLETTLERFGRLDILVNNAGATMRGTIETLTLDEFRQGMALNLDSQFLGIKTCMDALAKSAQETPAGSAVINNSSMAAYLVDPTNLRYHVSKAAGRMLTMCAAKELGPRRIRVNSVHYGLTDTPLVAEAYADYVTFGMFPDVDTARAALAQTSPLKTIGTAYEAGALIAYLASDDARYISGAGFVHDGAAFSQY